MKSQTTIAAVSLSTALPIRTSWLRRMTLHIRQLKQAQPETLHAALPIIVMGAAVLFIVLKFTVLLWFELLPSDQFNSATSIKSALQPRQRLVSTIPTPVSSDTKTHYQWQALPRIAPAPPNNPMSASKIRLGRELFNDKGLSSNAKVACASCHQLTETAYGTDSQAVSTGVENQQGTRNAPTVLNAAFQRSLFWDGRASSLEQQAMGPFINPIEMGLPSLDAVVDKVKASGRYEPLFRQAFPEQPEITIANIAKAIASYERTLITPDSPYDRFVRGEESALNQQQIRGMVLFESTGCVLCHSGPNFSAASLFGNDRGLRLFPGNPNTPYQAKYRITDDLGAAKQETDPKVGIWRVPSLRNVSKTAPYFHNGSVSSLEEAVRIMAQTQLYRAISNDPTNERRDPTSERRIHWSKDQQRFTSLDSISLTDADISDITAFLESLTAKLPERHKGEID